MIEIPFSLPEPAYLLLQSADGSAKARVDVYEARRMLLEAQNLGEADRWATVQEWIEQQLSVDPGSITENIAIDFNNLVVDVANKLDDDRKKKLASIAFLRPSTPASPATSEAGTSTKNGPG